MSRTAENEPENPADHGIRLHDSGPHTFSVWGTRAVFVLTCVNTVTTVAERRDAQSYLSILWLVPLAIFFQWAVWRASKVRLAGGVVEVGEGGNVRRIPVADIETVARPWFAGPARLGVLAKATVRNGRPFWFFPADGAEERLRKLISPTA